MQWFMHQDSTQSLQHTKMRAYLAYLSLDRLYGHFKLVAQLPNFSQVWWLSIPLGRCTILTKQSLSHPAKIPHFHAISHTSFPSSCHHGQLQSTNCPRRHQWYQLNRSCCWQPTASTTPASGNCSLSPAAGACVRGDNSVPVDLEVDQEEVWINRY